MLYELPLPMYPELIAFCGENSHFAEWVSANLREILEDTTLVVRPCGDLTQSKQVEKARGALEKEKLVNAAKHLQENAKSKPNRLEGSFKEAAQYWPEAPLSANYFADSLMFCREE